MAFALNSRRITLIVAVTMALAAGFLTIRYLSTAPRPSEGTASVSMRSVVIASRTIQPHEKIVPEMLTRVNRPATQVESGAFSEPREALGNVALIKIPEGAPLSEAKVGVPAALGVTGKLKAGLRAVSIPVDFIKSVSSLVSPGDRVDVLASNVKGHPHPTRAIIRGALVLAVNTALEPSAQPSAGPNNATTGPASVTLAVTADQANLLTFADNNTVLRLALRSPNEPIRAYPVQQVDVGDDGSGYAQRAVARPIEIPSTRIEPPALPAPAPAVGGNVPAPPVPMAVPNVDASQAHKAILVIEGDQIVAGQR